MSSKKNIDWSSIFSMPSIIYTLSGIFIAVVALKGFLIPNRFMDGGVTSMSIILYEMFNLDFSYFYVGINLIFVYFGYLRIGKTFAVHSFLAILILGLLSNFITLPFLLKIRFLLHFLVAF